MFVVIEGIDRTGKTTLIEKLKKTYPTYFFTREPGGLNDTTCESIRSILKNPNILDMDSITEALLFAASRNQHNIKIKKILESGKHVVSDRYLYSSLVYQGIYHKLGIQTIYDINKYSNIIEPDLIIYLKLSSFKEYLNRDIRNKKEGVDRIENNTKNFYDSILSGYDKILSKKNNVITIDASLEPDEIFSIASKYITNIKKER